MLRLDIRNRECGILDELSHLTTDQIKSRIYYPGYDDWFRNKFMAGYTNGQRDVISIRDKKYKTLVGFCLIKVGVENKICNLSPLIDGVGITQTLIDSALCYFSSDFTIDVPLLPETNKLSDKLRHLGFEIISQNISEDAVIQQTFIKGRNISWL